jgi:hypothetical protein
LEALADGDDLAVFLRAPASRGRGRPLGHATFGTQLRELGRRGGVRVTAHMFRAPAIEAA